MQDIDYYTKSGVNYAEIQKCAHGLGYHSALYDWYGPHLNVFFQNEDDPMINGSYCRWNEITETHELKRKKVVRKLNYEPEVKFWIEYRIVYLPQLVPLLKCLLQEYGGCVDSSLSFKLFTLNDISDLLSILLTDGSN